ncbi:MAG: polysaccharide biosynthesis protein [Firmicutes bacterium]|nr:polysaccharide biosynthesis protein [Bacillota bacterium]
MEKDGSVLQGTILLSLAAIFCKILGAAYRVPLVRLIGDEGIGLYQTAYPLYLVFLGLSTAGMPLAISRLVAERTALKDGEGVRRIFRLALVILGGLGLLGGAVLFVGARFFALRFVADPRAYPVLISLAPAVPLMSLTAAFRGFFQGLREMGPPALSQLLEQIVRVGTLLVLAYLLLPCGLAWAAAGAAFGATAGGAAGLIFLLSHYRLHPPKILRFSDGRRPPSYLALARRLMAYALPIAFGTLLYPLMQSLDSFLVPTRLQALGYPVSEATALLGRLGNAWAVIYVPTTITGALATSLLPAVAEAWTRRIRLLAHRQIRQALRLAVFLCLPGAAGIHTLADEICLVLYGTASAAPMLRSLAPAAFFLGLQGVCAGALQGMGRPFAPVGSRGLGFLFKAWLTVVLLPILGPRGAALGSVAGTALTAALSLVILARNIALPPGFFLTIFRSTLAGGMMLFALRLGLQYPLSLQFSPFFRLLFFLPLGAVLFGLGLWLTGGVEPGDVELLRRLGKLGSDVFRGRGSGRRGG